MKQRETILASGVSSETPIHTQATARPWRASNSSDVDGGIWIGGENSNVALVPGYNDHPLNIANAALIVKAVNRDHHFDELVKALEETTQFIEAHMHYSQPSHDSGEEPSDRFTFDAVPVVMDARAALAGAK